MRRITSETSVIVMTELIKQIHQVCDHSHREWLIMTITYLSISIHQYDEEQKLAFVRHVDFMNTCCMILKMHETFEDKLHTFIIKK